jgi:alpha-beta hydrolase superfamily lysophospholipase
MIRREFQWESNDKISIFAREWRPENEARAAVALVHGLGEHSGRYEYVADKLNRSGYGVVALDHRGHGRTGGIRGHFPSIEIVEDDIERLIQETSGRYPKKPVFLYGHSLGAMLSLYFGFTRKADLTGIIATSPFIAPGTPVPPVKLAFAKILYTLLPAMTLPNGLDMDRLSHDPQIKKGYLEDPLVHSQISARLGIDMLKTGTWLSAQTIQYPYPLFVMQGSDDTLVNPPATRTFAENLKGDVTFRWWPGMYHELHNEIVKEEVLDCILEWIELKLNGYKSRRDHE